MFVWTQPATFTGIPWSLSQRFGAYACDHLGSLAASLVEHRDFGLGYVNGVLTMLQK